MERVELKALTPPVDLQRCMASEAVSQTHGDIYPYIHIYSLTEANLTEIHKVYRHEVQIHTCVTN